MTRVLLRLAWLACWRVRRCGREVVRPGRLRRRASGLLCVGAPWMALLALTPLRASGTDALLLGDSGGGGRSSGSLTFCDDERCRLDRASVPLTQILWIGLGVGDAAPPRSVTTRGAVLADGSVRPGRLLGLSLGSVVLDTEELDRAQVRWVRVADMLPTLDLLVRRDGALRTGVLQGCTAASCTMAGETTARADLAWIGLAANPATLVAPAVPQDPMRDLAQFADGSTLATPLVGVGASDVMLGSGTFARAEIAWIYLAPPVPAAGPPVVYRPSGSPGAPSGPPPSAPPASAPRPPGGSGGSSGVPPAPGVPPPGAGERGALWSGTLRGIYRYSDSYQSFLHTFTIEIRAREHHFPHVADIADAADVAHVADAGVAYDWIRLQGEALSFAESYTFQEKFAGGRRCEGSGAVRGSGLPAEGELIVKPGAADLTADFGFDLPPGGGMYRLTPNPPGAAAYSVRCSDANGAWTIENSFLSPVIGRWPTNPAPTQTLRDPEVRYVEDGRMRGSFESAIAGGEFSAVSWSLCREGVACPAIPELPAGSGEGSSPAPPPVKDPCGDLAQERDLVDVLWKQRELYCGELEGAWNALEQARGEMLDNVEAYRAAIDACAIWDIVSETLESASGWAGEFTEFGTKVLSGDLSAFVGEEPWKSLSERAWDVLPRSSTWAGLMHDRITGCSAPLGHDLRSGALDFVDSWQRMRGMMPTVHEQLNRIRSQDLRYWEKWHLFYQTCLQWAACKGVPPTSCPRPPEQPRGPMPPDPAAE